MKSRVGEMRWHLVEHGAGTPVLVLHGAGVDHREAEACFEPGLGMSGDYRRIYPDLPGMGQTPAPPELRSADDVLEALHDLADAVVGPGSFLLVGHSAGAYYAQGFVARWPDRVAALALVCPLLSDVRDVPPHRPVVAADDLGDEGFRAYFVVQTPAMLARHEQFVAPAARLVDAEAVARIGQRWELSANEGSANVVFAGPTLLVAGRQDSTVGYAAVADLLDRYPRATLAVLDGAGHALPHEQPELMAALLRQWLARVASDLTSS